MKIEIIILKMLPLSVANIGASSTILIFLRPAEPAFRPTDPSFRPSDPLFLLLNIY